MRTKKRYTKKARRQRKTIQIQNKKLCKRYPFLIPHNRWTDKVIWKYRHDKDIHTSISIYPYCFTELDNMEPGWRKAFGIQMCEEIRRDLIKHNFLNKYRIVEIKEKYGELRWYDGGIPIGSKVWDIIEKYSDISTHTCYICGAPGKIINDNGWLVTMCSDCYKKSKEKNYGDD